MQQNKVPEEVEQRFQQLAQFEKLREELNGPNEEALLQYEEVYLDKRIGNLNKVHKFINRLKVCEEKGRPSLMKDLATYNLSSYLEEAANAIAYCQITKYDIAFFMELCSLIHQEYEQFGDLLSTALIKAIENGAGIKETEKQAIRRKNLLRLLGELYLCGVSIGPEYIFEGLKSAVVNLEYDANFLEENIISTIEFVQNFHKQFLGESSLVLKSLSEKYQKKLPVQKISLPMDQLKKIGLWLSQIYVPRIQAQLSQRFNLLLEEETRHQNVIKDWGKVKEEDKKQYDEINSKYQYLKKSLETINEEANLEIQIEDKDAHEIVKDKLTKIEEQKKREIEDSYREHIEIINYTFTDEKDQAIYEDISELKKLVPEILLMPISEEQEKINKEQYEQGLLPDTNEEEEKNDKSGFVMSSFKECAERLGKCDNIKAANSIAEEFCYINSYVNRRKLIDNIMQCYTQDNLKRLIPYKMRVLFILSKYFPTLIEDIKVLTIEKFKKFRQEEKYVFDSHKNVLCLCELTKFGAIEPMIILNCMKTYIDLLSPVNLDMVIEIIESCGKYLLLKKDSKMRFQMLMSFMQKKKEDKSVFDPIRLSKLKAALESIRIKI